MIKIRIKYFVKINSIKIFIINTFNIGALLNIFLPIKNIIEVL